MYRKMIIPVLLILILFGCMTDENTLDYPRSLHLNNEVLSWDAVEDATFYTLNINGEEYDTAELYFNLNFLQNGAYEIKILAYHGILSSEYSPVFNLVFERDYTAPQNLEIVDEIFLTWDAMELVTSYSVWMDDEEIGITWVPSYDLSLLSLAINQSHSFQVTGNYGIHSTLKSEDIEYLYLPRIGNTLSATYIQNQSDQVIVFFESSITVDSVLLEGVSISNDLYFQTMNSRIELDPSIFESLEIGVYELRLLTSTGYISVDLNVLDSN